MPGTTKATVLQ